MTNHEHPIRKAQLHTFSRVDGNTGTGVEFIARFHPYATWPVFFHGESEDAVIDKAEKFRTETIAQHEQAYQNRMAGRDKAKAARDRKALEAGQ
jgi:hypothetical protein